MSKKLKKWISEFFEGLIQGLICGILSMMLVSAILNFTNYYNTWFVVITTLAFFFVLNYRLNNWFHKKYRTWLKKRKRK